MPYIITVGTRFRDASSSVEGIQVKSRRAVATLEEANDIIARFVHVSTGAFGRGAHVHSLPESGGTVGPLPDGTVIEVQQASWDNLVGPEGWNASTTETEILNAYNAAQS